MKKTKTRKHDLQRADVETKPEIQSPAMKDTLSIEEREKETLPITKADVAGEITSAVHPSKDNNRFFITGNRDVQIHLCKQIIQSFVGPETTVDELEEISKRSIMMLYGIEPQDQVEAMLAAQMVATHNLAMLLIRNAHHHKDGIRTELYTNLASKTARIFTAQVEALGKYRNKGKQKIVVEHVTVNEGGQAIVGSEIIGGGGAKQ